MGEGVLTAGFRRREGALHCEDVPLAAIAEAVGTPTFVYSASAIREAHDRLATALTGLPVRIHYAVKANSNLAVLRVIQECGAGADIVSAGELHRARLAGFRGEDIVFAGVGKTRWEMEHALDAGVLFFNVESEGELALLAQVAAERGETARVSIRINPGVDDAAAGHAYITTGEAGSKFGIDVHRALDAARVAMAHASLELVGLDMHIGSQIGELAAYAAAQRRLRQLLDDVRAAGCTTLRWIDVGGGFPVAYTDDEPSADLAGFAALLHEHFGEAGVHLIVEPGRYLVAEAGVLLSTVLYRKTSGRKAFVVTDAAMNDLLRPSLYEAHHAIEPVVDTGAPLVTADIVGPVCETGDFLAMDRAVADVAPGTLLAIRDAGAYGAAMSSNYNTRPRAAEVLVQGNQWGVVAVRETLDDIVRRERVAPEWREA
jgi:diaminopimelate decarboxylase